MDSIIMHWQEILSLAIVGFTVIIMVRGAVVSRTKKKGCSACALMEMNTAQQKKL